MNAAKAASRMRARTAVSPSLSGRCFDIVPLGIPLSLTLLVPYSTLLCVVPNGTNSSDFAVGRVPGPGDSRGRALSLIGGQNMSPETIFNLHLILGYVAW